MRHVLNVFVAVTTVLTVASPASAGSVHSASADQAYVERMMYATSISGFVAAVGSDQLVRLEHRLLLGATGRQHRSDVQLHQLVPSPRLRLSQPATARPALRPGSLDRRIAQAGRPVVPRRHEGAIAGRVRGTTTPTCMAWAETFYAGVRVAGGPSSVTVRVALGRRCPGPPAAADAESARSRPRSSRRRARRRRSDDGRPSKSHSSSRNVSVAGQLGERHPHDALDLRLRRA